MQFQSFNYLLLFLPLVLVLYYLNNRAVNKNLILIISSFIFYAWGNPLWGILLFMASAVDFAVSRKLGSLDLELETSPKELHDSILLRRKFLLIASLFFNFSLLAFFKYWNWVVDSLYLLNDKNIFFDLRQFKHDIAIPAGISFYTFETVSYTIDVYRRKLKPTSSFINYLSFVSFFPHLVAGPILRANDLLPQLEKFRKKVTSRVAESGFFLIAWGLFKKLVFADNLGNLVARCKENLDTPGVGLILAIAFTFQIYCDFSAYTDIARGTARLFGIKIKRNFLTPYLSVSPSDLWQRWHITLSSWVRDYIYIPLGGNKVGIIRSVFNILLTMFIMGLWHGAGKFFVLWGLYHGLLIIIYRILPLDVYLYVVLGRILGKIISIILMFSFVVFGYVLFFSKTDQEFISIFTSLKNVSYLFTNSYEAPIRFWELSWGLLLFTLPIIITDIIGFIYKREFVDLHKFFGIKTKIIIYFLMFYIALLFGARGSYDFIYFQF